MNNSTINKADSTNEITKNVQQSLEYFNQKIKNCPDIIIKKVVLNDKSVGYFLYVDGLINADVLQRDLISPIIDMEFADLSKNRITERLPVANLYTVNNLDEAIKHMLNGKIIFILDGLELALVSEIKQFDRRGITEPQTEKSTRSSHEGFIEVLNINLSILRRKIQNTNLKFEKLEIGTETKQNLAIVYIEGIVNPVLVRKVNDKINKITYDGFTSVGMVEQLITDHPYSVFPLFLSTERPDRAVANLLEGRIIIMLDGTPTALIAPVDFFSFFQAGDDYSTNWMFGSFERLLRLLSGIIGVFLPAIYIAMTAFHYYIVPFNLLIPLAESRSRVSFPPAIEAFVMELTIEIIREASIRLPTYIGTTIGVVGGLVIGQAAVQAGIVSTVFVIIVGVTAMCSYSLPNYDMGLALRLIRFAVMIMASILGILGMVICSSSILAYLITLDSLGQPYFSPIVPFKIQDIKDTLIRSPIKLLRKRPISSGNIQVDRRKNND